VTRSNLPEKKFDRIGKQRVDLLGRRIEVPRQMLV
jgi:hypothetical protein